MASKRKTAVNGALLGAAATALSVNGAMASPLGGTAPVHQLKHALEEKRQATLVQSSQMLDQIQARLVGALVRVPPTAIPRGATASAAPGHLPQSAAIQGDPPAGELYSVQARHILRDAALRHQLDPKLVLALSYWESGWDQSLVSPTGAVGLMQVEPPTAAEAGPNLLGRAVNINDPYDNADVGAALFRADLDAFQDPALALAAYYQGASSLRQNGMFPDTRQYVDGILALAAGMNTP